MSTYSSAAHDASWSLREESSMLKYNERVLLRGVRPHIHQIPLSMMVLIRTSGISKSEQKVWCTTAMIVRKAIDGRSTCGSCTRRATSLLRQNLQIQLRTLRPSVPPAIQAHHPVTCISRNPRFSRTTNHVSPFLLVSSLGI